MKKEILDQILEQYLEKQGIHQDGIEYLKKLVIYREKKKESAILEMGERSDFICYIVKGVVRGVYISEEGEEVTKCFSREDQWCCVYNMIAKTPSAYRIEVLEDSILACFPIHEVKQFMNERFDAQRMYAKLYEMAFVQEQERSVSFQKLSATERYQAMLENDRNLVERVDQKYIASYLGITASSLSRIRRGMKKESKKETRKES